jgi:hypothetical protein
MNLIPPFLLNERASIILDWTSSLVMVSTVWGWLYRQIKGTLDATYDFGNKVAFGAALAPAYAFYWVAMSNIKWTAVKVLIWALLLIPLIVIVLVNIVIGLVVWLLRSTLNDGALGKILFLLAFLVWNLSKLIAWKVVAQ